MIPGVFPSSIMDEMKTKKKKKKKEKRNQKGKKKRIGNSHKKINTTNR